MPMCFKWTPLRGSGTPWISRAEGRPASNNNVAQLRYSLHNYSKWAHDTVCQDLSFCTNQMADHSLGIIVHAGSNFGRPKFTLRPSLLSRASTQTTTLRVTLIITAVSLVVCGIFCCGVGLLIWKNKKNKKKRAQKFEELRPFVQHQYNALPDDHAGTYTSQGHLQELSNEDQAYQMGDESQKFELPARVVHNLDGFAAPVGLTKT
jgi:hypothetical protein